MAGTVTMNYETEGDVIKAARFVAELVRQGVVFEVAQEGRTLVVTFTGGF